MLAEFSKAEKLIFYWDLVFEWVANCYLKVREGFNNEPFVFMSAIARSALIMNLWFEWGDF